MADTRVIKRLAVKVGSNILADKNGLLDTELISNLTRQLSDLRNSGVEVILISSGAVASGKGIFKPKSKTDSVGFRQMWSSLGQVRLIQTYTDLLKQHGLMCAQVLVTKDDFRSRQHYLNIKNCFFILLKNGIIPIVNENDVVSVTELMFTDNDELAGLVSTMLSVDALYILTNVNGVLKQGDGTEVIREILPGQKEFEKHIQKGKSDFGRGGMLTKIHIARKVAEAGIEVRIANGRNENILHDLLEDNAECTRFIPTSGKSSIKKWLAHTEGYEKGAVTINEGVVQALMSEKATSILPVGVVDVSGNFDRGDIIKIYTEKHEEIGVGMAQYNADAARRKMGMQRQRPVIHYDYLFLK
ncbi:glutamate 5-kinase [Bacteroidota bacterium]